MARPVVLSFRWTFAPSYYYVFHCLASCLRPIGFPTGGINKDNPIADSISSPTWLVATSRRSAGTKICKKPCLVFLFFHPSCEKKNTSLTLAKIRKRLNFICCLCLSGEDCSCDPQTETFPPAGSDYRQDRNVNFWVNCTLWG